MTEGPSAAITVDSATSAAWVGAAGTWVVGGIAALIAIMQYLSSKFRPKVTAFREETSGRLVVQIDNRGSGAGVVQAVSLTTPAHLLRPDVQEVLYQWEIAGEVSESRPVPFGLDGGASAQLFLRIDPTDNSLMNPFDPAGNRYPLDAVRVRLDYGAGERSRCIAMEVVRAPVHIEGTTYIPGCPD
ncbi:hypothetical protein [Flexivirga alba]|uniref:Uncharacterized protein n=1 Tax=Flexivirga alba TaxID=702742 RepID=A0ABW2AHZ3_9MICO